MNAPRWIRVYDNGGKTVDRYTVVFTGNYAGRNYYNRACCMSDNPYHPQGVYSWEEYQYGYPIDKPSYSHLGKRITFDKLPTDCQKQVWIIYNDLWGTK